MNIYKIFVKPMVLLGLAVSLSSAMEPAKTKACPALTAGDVVHLIKGGFITHGNKKFVMAKGDQERLPKLFNMEILLNADPSEIPNISMFTANETKIIDLKRDNENYRCQYRGDLSSELFQNNPEKIHLQIVQFKGREWLVDEEFQEVEQNKVLEGKVSLLKFRDGPLDGSIWPTRKDYRALQTFSIKDLLLPDGSLDLGKFDMNQKDIIVTTNPDMFFQVRKNDPGYIILIAPKSLIAERLSTTMKPLNVIMNEWDEKRAPIGIFSRLVKDKNTKNYTYLIDQSIDDISSEDLLGVFIKEKITPLNRKYSSGMTRTKFPQLSRYLFDFR